MFDLPYHSGNQRLPSVEGTWFNISIWDTDHHNISIDEDSVTICQATTGSIQQERNPNDSPQGLVTNFKIKRKAATPVSHFFLSANAVVSTLAAISRTTLAFSISSCLGQVKWNWFKKQSDNLIGFDRFDDASRGPWGSLWLIIWLRASHWVILTAIVTIISMAFEPLLQVVISFSGQMNPIDSGNPPYIGRSQVLDTGTFGEVGSSGVYYLELPGNLTVSYTGYLSQPNLGLVSAFNNGFYNPSTTQPTLFYCPTTNFTWPITSSLAICSVCNNITDRLERRRQLGEPPNSLIEHSVQNLINYRVYALPLVNITKPSDTLVAATRITDSQLTVSFRSLSTMISAVQIIRYLDKNESYWLVPDEVAITAIECALYFCVNAYESVVERGILSERIISAWSERDPGSFQCGSRNILECEAYERWSNHSLYMSPPSLGDFDRTDLEFLRPANSTFWPPEDTTTRFRLTLSTILSTTQFVNDVFFTDSMIWPLRGDSNVYPPIGQALIYHSKNLSETFENAAQALSNWMRDISDVKQNGTAQEWVTHIQVNWSYTALPVISIVSGLGFCLYCIFETHRLQLEPWKTDMIATLTHSVDAETRAQLRHANRNGYLRRAVKAMAVRFEDSGSGYELRAQHS
ncbi:hypothetical protein F5X99DRAFT_427659 [Biscogniauxia marginata]|nr:hypothetical protein F5X99DRAFT_427659 [Biscogniauxia marginata]